MGEYLQEAVLPVQYDNYVFDLYGTLVDIHTEEDFPKLWEKLALFFGYYGAIYEPKELQKRYAALVSDCERALKKTLEEEAADADTAEKEAAAQAEQERKQAEEDAKKAAEEAEVSGSEQTGSNKVTKYAATFLGVLALVGLVAGGGIYTFMKQKQKKQAEKEALDPDANYTEDKGDFEIPVEDEPDADESPDEQEPENS